MGHRIERVNNLIRQEVSELLQRQVRDPRLGGLVTVTEVSASADLSLARIFVSSICGEEEKQATLNGLAAASGFLRSALAKRLGLRRMPELKFEWDDSIERGAHVLELLDEVAAERPPEGNE